MTTPPRRRRPRNARLVAHIAVVEQALAHLLRVNPPPPGSPDQWIRNIEAMLEGPLFRHWDQTAKAQFLNDARIALTALLHPPSQEDPSGQDDPPSQDDP